MIRVIALGNNSFPNNNSFAGKIIKDQVYLAKSSHEKYYEVFSLDNIYVGFFERDWFILESIYLGRLREQQIKSVLE